MTYQQVSSAAWLQSYPWDLLVTTRIPPNLPHLDAYGYLLAEVLQPVAKFSHEQTAVVTVIVPRSPYESAHMHSLILTKDHHDMDIQRLLQERIYDRKRTLNTHSGAIDIEKVNNVMKAASYVARHIKEDGYRLNSKEDMYVECYNRRLLEKMKGTYHGSQEAHQLHSLEV